MLASIAEREQFRSLSAAMVRNFPQTCSISPHLFIYIKAKAGENASFSHPRQPVLSVITSIRREAVAALQVVDALHLVGSQL